MQYALCHPVFTSCPEHVCVCVLWLSYICMCSLLMYVYVCLYWHNKYKLLDSQKKTVVWCWSQPAAVEKLVSVCVGWGDVDVQFQLWKPQRVCVCVWEDPLLYSMVLWDCCVFKLKSSLIGGWVGRGTAKRLQGQRWTFLWNRERAPGGNQTHNLVIGQGWGVWEGHRGGSIPHSLLHRQDCGQQYTIGLTLHTHNVWDGLELLMRQMGTAPTSCFCIQLQCTDWSSDDANNAT